MPCSVLIADDHPSVRNLLIRLIRRASPKAHIIDVESGQAALDLYRQSGPKFVVLDHGLPDMSGFHVLRELKATDQAPYVIVVTGNPTLESEARERGADEVWLKPMDIGVLLPHLTQLFEDA